MTELISIENVSLGFSRRQLFQNLSFNIKEKDLIAINGPNGSGKTSLVRMILGFTSCKFGKITHFKEKLYGYVPQHFHPIEYMNITVLNFLKLSEMGNIPLDDVISMIKIENLLHLNLNSLSGGELRRVLIAKTLLFSKNALFLDEPTCWLDKQSQQDFYKLISDLNAKFNMAIILISHDPFFKEDFFSQIVKLDLR